MVNEYFWNKYAGPAGLSAEGVKYGILDYVRDLKFYCRSIANLQFTAIHLISWAVEPELLRAEAERAIASFGQQATRINDFVPYPIDITDEQDRGDEFFIRGGGNSPDACYTLREPTGSHRYLTLCMRGQFWMPIISVQTWGVFSPQNYHWKFVPSYESVTEDEYNSSCRYKLVGWDPLMTDDSEAIARPLQWERDSEFRGENKMHRYTVRDRGVTVLFKIIVVKQAAGSKNVVVRLVDSEVGHGTDGQTADLFSNHDNPKQTFQVKFQGGQRYNKDFNDSSSAYDGKDIPYTTLYQKMHQ